MTGKMTAICILVLSASVFAVSSWNTTSASVGDCTQDVKALERRIGELEMAMKKVTKLVTSDVDNTMGFYRETRAAMKRSSARTDSLERRMSESERQRADFEALNSRVADLETRISELERRQVVARKQVTNTDALREGSVRSQRAYGATGYAQTAPALRRDDEDRRRLPRSGPVVRVFIFDVGSQGGRTEIRYYTVRDISVEDIRLPAYLVHGLERVRR